MVEKEHLWLRKLPYLNLLLSSPNNDGGWNSLGWQMVPCILLFITI